MQQLPGQHEPPPQQSLSLATGVAAVSASSAASMSMYFITPPNEFHFNLGATRRPSRCGGELNAGRGYRRTVRPSRADAVVKQNIARRELRDRLVFSGRAHQYQKKARGGTAIRRRRVLIWTRVATATIRSLRHPRPSVRLSTAARRVVRHHSLIDRPGKNIRLSYCRT
jgi:hypothetical protein